MSIGVIGLGLLGGALAKRLLASGWDVVGYDTDPERCEAMRAAGGRIDRTEEIFRQCEQVLFSLPTSEVVASVLEEHGRDLVEGSVVIDTTTGVPEQMTAHGRSLHERGVAYVEATIAGSSVQAEQGRAVVFVGGEATVLPRALPVIEAISDRYFHLGPIGSASRFKLVHNLVLGLHRAVLAEGLSFAESLGFDSVETLRILRQTPAASEVMETKGAKMVNRDWTVQAKLAQHLKDVRLMLDEGVRAGTPLPLSKKHRDLLQQAVDLGFGDADNSSILEAFLVSRRSETDQGPSE